MRSYNKLLIGIAILAACVASDASERRDFGPGVKVVHNAVPAHRDQLRLSRTLLIGEEDDDSAAVFGRISGLAVSSDGRIYVADAYANRILAFAAGGEYIRSFGRSGRGPGEFVNLGRVWSVGDTVLAEDLDAQRFSAFDSTGRILTTAPMTDVTGSVTFLVGRSAAGWVGEIRSIAAGDGRADIWRYPLTEAYVIDPYRRVTLRSLYHVPHPDSSSASALFGGVRRGGTIGHDYVYLIVQADPYEVHVFDLEGGSLRQVILQDYKPRKVDAAWLRTAEARIADYYMKRPTPPGWSGGADDQLRRLSEANVNEFAAPVAHIMSDSAGFLWVQRQDLSTDMSDHVVEYLGLRDGQRGDSTWDIFNPSGTLVGQVVLPSAFRLMAVRALTAYGVVKDDLGVERVAKYVVGPPA